MTGHGRRKETILRGKPLVESRTNPRDVKIFEELVKKSEIDYA